MTQRFSHPVPASGFRPLQEYQTPEAELILIRNERSFLISDDHNGDHEHTEEEELF